jgi:hypothetical protein
MAARAAWWEAIRNETAVSGRRSERETTRLREEKKGKETPGMGREVFKVRRRREVWVRQA